jgi:CheY-like chemotaxis protein
VAVASAEDEGACFAVWLPLYRSKNVGTVSIVPRMAPAKDAPPPVERFALVVEDDDQAAELVRLLLQAEGFTVVRAASAEDALKMAPQQALSLITLDLQLPGINGWEFLKKIRDNVTLTSVPVVIISSLPVSNLALSRGAAAVLEKPFSRAQLKASLAELNLSPAADRTFTVLVVDDDPKAVEVIATFLPAPAYEVVRAFGGREAIALTQQLMPHLVLLDLMMPDVNGFDVVAALQRDAATSHIPILIVTAKQVTQQDRSLLRDSAGVSIPIVEKAGFNRAGFISEVRRALAPS